MKISTPIIKRKFEKLSLLTVMLFASFLAFAQDTAEPLDVDITTTETTTTTTEWMSNPLYWVVGALVLIILIAVIVRGKKD